MRQPIERLQIYSAEALPPYCRWYRPSPECHEAACLMKRKEFGRAFHQLQRVSLPDEGLSEKHHSCQKRSSKYSRLNSPLPTRVGTRGVSIVRGSNIAW